MRFLLLTLIGIHVAFQAGAASGVVRLKQFNKSYAIVIGIDKYDSQCWTSLSYAVRDARSVSGILKEQGFEVYEFYDHHATKSEIVRVIEDTIYSRLTKADRVVFFFAGHGASRKSGSAARGYLVPYDASSLFSSFIPMASIQDWSTVMSLAIHQLFILDTCFGGLAGLRGSTALDPRMPDYLDAITTRSSRQLLFAGGADQRVLDNGADGHSLFTGNFLKAVRDGLADQNGDGYITLTEIAGFVQVAASKPNQTPALAMLEGHELGDFVFVNRSNSYLRQQTRLQANFSGDYRADSSVYEYLRAGKSLFLTNAYRAALSEFQKAAELGNAEAMGFLGTMIWDGKGVDSNKDLALHWLNEGAERGDLIAIENLVAALGHIAEERDHKSVNHGLVIAERFLHWTNALAEAQLIKANLRLLDPTGSSILSEPSIPREARLLHKPEPPKNLRLISPQETASR
jgi:hypothetical protein